MSGDSDVSAILLVALAFGGFIVTAGSTTQPNGEYFVPTNLGVIPTCWGDYPIYGDIVYTSVAPPSANQICDYDTTVERTGGAGSARLDPYLGLGENTAREINGNWIAVKPGDLITFSCWMKTTASGLGDIDPYSGTRIGFDFYNANGRICGKQSDGATVYPTENAAAIQANYVPWNTAAWTQRTITYTVPATLTRESDSSSQVATGFIPWMQIWSSTFGSADTGQGWFADASIVITPLDETPLIEPSFSALTLSDSTVERDTIVTCNVTVDGSGVTPTGTVQFYVSEVNNIETWRMLGVPVTLDASGEADSIGFYPASAGNYWFKAEYSGDTVYTDFSSTNTLLTVNNPVVATAPSMLGVLGRILTAMENY
jgi:hypothetical protein